MRLLARHLALLAAIVAAVLGCASNPSAERSPRTDRDILSPDELTQQYFRNAYEAVEALRSNWLQTRGPDSFQNPSIVWIYQDNVKLGGVETLRTVEIAAITALQHYNGIDATARWGIGHGAGVIFVSTIPRRQKGDDRIIETTSVTENAPRNADGVVLSSAGRSAALFVSGGDFPDVVIAARELRDSVARVTGAVPAFAIDTQPTARHVAVVGTLGRNPFIDKLVRDGRLDVVNLAGKEERYLRQVVANPVPGIDQALIIVGSDRRGTLNGIRDLSVQIDNSFWYWIR